MLDNVSYSVRSTDFRQETMYHASGWLPTSLASASLPEGASELSHYAL